jgi:tetratricopeptide (TPR) repeat protein
MGYLYLSQKGGLAILLSSLVAALLIIIVPTPLIGLLLLTAAIALLATRRDIIVLTILTTALLVVPFAYEKGMASLLALDSSFFKAARLSTSGINRPENDAGLRQPATNQSQLALQLFSQAESARQRQEFSQAEVFLEKIIANKIEIGAVYNNLANIYLLQGKSKNSEKLFIKAANLEKSSGIPYYNLSRAYIQQSFDLKKSSQALEMAFKRDQSLSADDSTDGNFTAKLKNRNKLIFMSLPEDFYRRYADAQPNKDIYLPEFLHQLIFPGTGRTLYFALVILTIIGLFYLERQAPSNRRICSECGRLFDPIQKLKEKQCPVCYLKQQSQTGSQLKNMADSAKRPVISLPNVCRTAAGALLPGFYPLITGNTYIAAALMTPAILWLYNFLICQTEIMAPFPPSTKWLISVAPFLIWMVNLIVLIMLITYRQRHNTLSGSNA